MCFSKLFRRKKKEVLSEDIFVPETKSLVSFVQFKDSTDETLTKIAEEIKKGIPHILNFDLLEIDEANKAMAFYQVSFLQLTEKFIYLEMVNIICLLTNMSTKTDNGRTN